MSTTSTPTTSRTPRTGFVVCLVIALALLVVSIIAYPHMAPELVTRPAGNGHGENSPSREFTAFVPPLILVVVAGLIALAPRFNPRFLERFPAGAVANTENSTKVLNCVLVLVGILIAALHLGLIALYMGFNAPLEAIMTTAAGIVVTGLGAVLPWTRPEGRFNNPTLERYRAGSARAYRPAGYLLMAAGVLTIVLAWLSPTAAMIVGIGSIVAAFGLIAVRGIRSAASPRN